MESFGSMLKKLFRDKFDIILVGFIFLSIFVVWVWSGFNPEVKDFLIGIFSAFLALLGVRPRPNQQTDIEAANIETANTETGDIKVTPKTVTTKEN